MMARIVALYKPPKDPAAFDNYYFATHVPIAKRLPGLRKYEVSQGAVASPGGASGVPPPAVPSFRERGGGAARVREPRRTGHGRRCREIRHRRRRHIHVRSAGGVGRNSGRRPRIAPFRGRRNTAFGLLRPTKTHPLNTLFHHSCMPASAFAR